VPLQRYSTADWVTTDALRPRVPFNISDLATYIENLRDLTHGTYDQWLDYREVMVVGNLTEMAEVLRKDGVYRRTDCRTPAMGHAQCVRAVRSLIDRYAWCAELAFSAGRLEYGRGQRRARARSMSMCHRTALRSSSSRACLTARGWRGAVRRALLTCARPTSRLCSEPSQSASRVHAAYKSQYSRQCRATSGSCCAASPRRRRADCGAAARYPRVRDRGQRVRTLDTRPRLVQGARTGWMGATFLRYDVNPYAIAPRCTALRSVVSSCVVAHLILIGLILGPRGKSAKSKKR
jgi:hypothetical protein